MKEFFVYLRKVQAWQPQRTKWTLHATTQQLAHDSSIIQEFRVRAASRDEAVANVVAQLSGRLVEITEDSPVELDS